NEHVARVACERGQAAQVAGVTQLVEIDDRLGVMREPVENEVGADETRATGNEDHERVCDVAGATLGREEFSIARLRPAARRNRSSPDTRPRTARGPRRAACAARSPSPAAGARSTRTSPV